MINLEFTLILLYSQHKYKIDKSMDIHRKILSPVRLPIPPLPRGIVLHDLEVARKIWIKKN
jgi:hypothetical protein